MTNEELLDLVATKSPGELSLEQVQALHDALAKSAELREHFASRLALQTYLADIQSRLAASAIEEASTQPQGPRHWASARRLLALLAIATLLLAIVAVIDYAFWPRWFSGAWQIAGKATPSAESNDEAETEKGEKDSDDRQMSPDEQPGRSSEDDSIVGADGGTTTEKTPTDSHAVHQVNRATVPVSPDEDGTAGEAEPPVDAVPEDESAPNLAVDPADSAVIEETPRADSEGPPPWQEALTSADAPPRFDDICFDRFHLPDDLPQVSDLQRWFEVLVGNPKGIVAASTRAGRSAAFEGLVRLRAPWTEDSAIRFSLENYNRLQLHLYHGLEGVTLAYHEHRGNEWVAYATTRVPPSLTPDTYRLSSTDGGRNQRTQIRLGGPFELRYRRGEMILSRGDIVLLRAPLAGPPEVTLLQGRATFRGIRWLRSTDEQTLLADQGGGSLATSDDIPAPAESMPEQPVARLDWASSLAENASFQRGTLAGPMPPQPNPPPPQAVRLETAPTPKRSWIATRRLVDRPHELILEIDDATPGSGIYLGAGEDPRVVLRYVSDRRTGQVCLIPRGNDDHVEQDFPAIDDQIFPSIAGRHWVRLVLGGESLRWWISDDGRHWAEPQPPLRKPLSEMTHVGLHCIARRKCGITLLSMKRIELDTLAEFDPPALPREQIPLPDAKDIKAWETAADATQPSSAAAEAWRPALAVRTLSSGCPRSLAISLVQLLASEARRLDWPVARQFRLLDQAALLVDTYTDNNQLQQFVGMYRAAGESTDRKTLSEYSMTRRALMRSPMISRHAVETADPNAIRRELLGLTYAERWTEVLNSCRSLHFFHGHTKAPLVAWAATIAGGLGSSSIDIASGGVRQRPPENWREIVVEQLSKEAFNASAELNALLESGADDEVARRITTLDLDQVPGMTPDSEDERLLVSIPTLIQLLVRRHPSVSAYIAENHAELATMRLAKATAGADPAQVEAITVLFPTTDAAADAHRWLGDRAALAGWLDEAGRHYQRAASTSSFDIRPDDEARATTVDGERSMQPTPRERLVDLLEGATEGPATSALQIGPSHIGTAEADSIRVTSASRNLTSTGGMRRERGFAGDHRFAPAPTPFVAGRRLRLDGPSGRDPHRFLHGGIDRLQVDWAGRQLGLAVDGDVAYVNNRFHIAAYDLRKGTRLWQTQPPPGKVRYSQDWSLTSMRPLLRGDRMITRQLYGDGAALVCVSRTDGQLQWMSKPRANVELISDPVFVRDTLVCLTLSRVDYGQSVVRWTTFDPYSGAVWSEHDLLHVSAVWFRRHYCEIQPSGDSLYVMLGGAVACCKPDGSLRWLRRQTVTPPDEEPAWVAQSFSPPLLQDGRLFAVQPGVWEIECLDAATGEQLWHRTEADLRQLVGIADGRLVFTTDRAIAALDSKSGVELWRANCDAPFHANLFGSPHRLLTAHRHALDEKASQFAPRLSWRDIETGDELGTAILSEKADREIRFGPMIAFDQRIWAFSARGKREPNRNLIEWVPEAIVLEQQRKQQEAEAAEKKRLADEARKLAEAKKKQEAEASQGSEPAEAEPPPSSESPTP